MYKEGRNKTQCRHCNEFVGNKILDAHEQICSGRAKGDSTLVVENGGPSKTQQIKDLVKKRYGMPIEINYGMGEMQCKRIIKSINLKLWVDVRKEAESSQIDFQDALLKILSKEGA
jgi:hypothetical protein